MSVTANTRILVDTNVLVDVVTMREPFFADSAKVVGLCQKKIVKGAIAAHSIVNMAYILRKNFRWNGCATSF